MTTRIGIDAGGTLTKIAYWNDEKKSKLRNFYHQTSMQ